MRPDWDVYFLALAEAAAQRSTCGRATVGCLIVDAERVVVGTGYNGAPSGLPHCDDVGHLLVDDHCVRTIHAEINAVKQAGRSARGSTCYVTHFPCLNCTKALLQAKVARLVYREAYRVDPYALGMLLLAGVLVEPMGEDMVSNEVLSAIQAINGAAAIEIGALDAPSPD